jgi:two-component sensor histidine kinase
VNAAPSIHLFLGPDASAPRRARRVLRSELGSVLEADVLDQAMLLVSELVTNSVRHGGLRPDQ